MDYTGSLRAQNERKRARARAPQMSYEYRVGQVERVLATTTECTIYDLAKRLDMSHRGMHTICERMAREGRISVRQVPHRNWFKHLISRRQP